MSQDKALMNSLVSLIQGILNVSAKCRYDCQYTARQIALCVIDESEELYELVPNADNIFDLATVYAQAYLKGE